MTWRFGLICFRGYEFCDSKVTTCVVVQEFLFLSRIGLLVTLQLVRPWGAVHHLRDVRQARDPRPNRRDARVDDPREKEGCSETVPATIPETLPIPLSESKIAHRKADVRKASAAGAEIEGDASFCCDTARRGVGESPPDMT